MYLDSTNTPRLIPRLVALFAATLVVGAAGCERADEVGTTVEEVRDWPGAYMGKVVTLVGEVQEKYATGSFTLDGAGTWWNDDILVVVPRQMDMTIGEDSKVRVTGEIRDFVVAEVERDYGIDFDETVEVEFRDKPVVVAQTIELLEHD